MNRKLQCNTQPMMKVSKVAELKSFFLIPHCLLVGRGQDGVEDGHFIQE